MTPRLKFLTLLTAGLLVSTAASATIVTAGGVGIPTGPVVIDQNDFETRITPTTPNFEGVGFVSNISTDGGTTNQTYGLPLGVAPPPYLYDEFSGFTLSGFDNINPTTGAIINSSAESHIFLTGGELNYYGFASPVANFNAMGSAQADVNYLKTNGSLWLSLTPVAFDSNGDTVKITIPAGSDLQNIGLSSALAFLDVNMALNGAANAFFDTCDVADSSAPGPGSSSPPSPAPTAHDCLAGMASVSFIGGAQDILPPNSTDFAIHGTDNDQTTAAAPVSIPEPLTISLFGAGLIGLAALGRRKTRQGWLRR